MIYRSTFNGVEDEKPCNEKPTKQDELVRKTWDKKNDKLV